MGKVLLTGGSGFIAAHILESLLQRGHEVVFTVRSDEKGQFILKSHTGVSSKRLSYVIVEDIAQEGSFDKAVISDPPFDAVIHAASPFFFGHKDPVKEILDPAIKGTTGILNAIYAYAPSVKKVVVTSSFAAIVNANGNPKVYSEANWNPVTEEQALQPQNTYRASKTFAEKAAWKFVEEKKPNFNLSTMCPPLVLGPVVHYLKSLDSINTSNARVVDLVQGKYKDEIAPTGTFTFVDVRDLALAHVKALEVPDAAGKRFYIVGGYFSNKQIADVIRETHPELESKLPSKDAKDDFPKDIFEFDNRRSKEILGLEYRSLKESIGDTVKTLLELQK